jgi:hypothetical protein
VFHQDVSKEDLDVAYVFKCFRRFRLSFQEFNLDVAKVDLDVVYVAMTKYTCCKLMFQMFQVFQAYVANVSSDISKVDLGIAHVVNGYTRLFQSHVSSVSSIFRRMLQLF